MPNLHKIAGMELKTSNQEVDFLEVLARFYHVIRKNMLLAIILPLGCAVTTILVFSSSEMKVESSMMVVTNLLTRPECNFLLTELEKADSFMGVSPEQRAGLLVLSHEIVSESELKGTKEPIGPNVHVQINIQVTNHELLRVFENSIMTYLESSRPALRKKYEFHEYYTTMIAEIDRELASLKQLKGETDPKVLANSFNPSDLYMAVVNLSEKKVSYELHLKNNNVFQLVQGFDTLSRSSRFSKTLAAAMGFCVGFGILMVILFIRHFSGYYRQYRQSLPS